MKISCCDHPILITINTGLANCNTMSCLSSNGNKAFPLPSHDISSFHLTTTVSKSHRYSRDSRDYSTPTHHTSFRKNSFWPTQLYTVLWHTILCRTQLNNNCAQYFFLLIITSHLGSCLKLNMTPTHIYSVCYLLSTLLLLFPYWAKFQSLW